MEAEADAGGGDCSGLLAQKYLHRTKVQILTLTSTKVHILTLTRLRRRLLWFTSTKVLAH